jgi:glutaredoxin-like protein
VENTITIFGTWWCGDCTRVRRYLDRNQVPYQWVDIDKDPEGEKFVISTNHGFRSVPTLVFNDGSILVEPTEKDLRTKLGSL